MITIVKNKYVNALLLLMLFSASIHMVILVYAALTTRNFYLLNYFNILDIDLLYPDIFSGTMGGIIALLTVLAVYLTILVRNREA